LVGGRAEEANEGGLGMWGLIIAGICAVILVIVLVVKKKQKPSG
jgi:uncharacterized integral membrane protein